MPITAALYHSLLIAGGGNLAQLHDQSESNESKDNGNE